MAIEPTAPAVVAAAPPPPPANNNPKKPLNNLLVGLMLLFYTVLMLVLAWKLQGYGQGQNYVAVMVLMLLFIITLGFRISGRWDGILVSERNLISLSRFQMVLWTVIILGAYLTAAIGRIKTGSIADALGLTLDPQLWGVLGISTASLIGTPLLQTTKTAQQPNGNAAEKTSAALVAKGDGETVADINANAQGVLYANASIQDAAFTDMFEGDEVGNTAYIDVSKLQMFFFTVVAALSYGILLHQWIAGHLYKSNAHFPLVSGGLIAILGISHAGFLVGKSTTHTPTT